MKTSEGEWKGGVWTPMVNNKNGYNKHKKNSKPPEKPEKPKTKQELTVELGEIYHKQWLLKREILSLGL